jgi:hypothetical protein
VVQELLATWMSNADSSWFRTLVDNLNQRSETFRAWWPLHDVCGAPIGRTDLDHPRVGRLALEPTMFSIAMTTDERVVVYTPLSEAETARKLFDLARAAPAYTRISAEEELATCDG